jgi:hypothetical protein
MYELQLFNNYTTNSSPSGINGPPITYIGIEAADYYGGRIVAGELVSGAEKNPIGLLIFELFSQNKNDDNYLLYSHQTWSDIYFSQDGRAMPQKKVSNARTAWANAYECLQREGRDDTRSMADVLRTDCGWNPAARSPLENLFSFYELDWEFVLDPEFASAKGNLPMWTYYLMQGKDWFVSSEGKYHADGSIDVPPNLATVADKAVKAYITNYGQITERTMLNTEIDKVIWGDGTDDCVEVQYAGGSESVIAKKVRIVGLQHHDYDICVAHKLLRSTRPLSHSVSVLWCMQRKTTCSTPAFPQRPPQSKALSTLIRMIQLLHFTIPWVYTNYFLFN